MGKKLYVGNLTYRMNSSDLEQLFSQYGNVESAEVISDRDTGRSKGFGFVEMSTDAEAKAAIDALHDHEVDGRRLTVNEARPREPAGGWRRRWRRRWRWRLRRRRRWRRGGGGGYDGGAIDRVPRSHEQSHRSQDQPLAKAFRQQDNGSRRRVISARRLRCVTGPG